jgi:hypothetical protein
LVEDENAVPALYLIMIIQHYSVLIFMKKVWSYGILWKTTPKI